MPIHTDYIRTVLARFEGKGHCKGYMPCDKQGRPFGVSGVTIATGVDLGQTSRQELAVMGVPDDILNAVGIYLGVKGMEAKYLVARSPLTLTPEQVEQLDACVHASFIQSAGRLFGQAAFAAAPRQVQAVAVSLHYQFGSPRRKTSPALGNAWDAMRRGDYTGAAEYLRDPAGWSHSHRAYMRRRQQEAALLDEAARG